MAKASEQAQKLQNEAELKTFLYLKKHGNSLISFHKPPVGTEVSCVWYDDTPELRILIKEKSLEVR